MKDTCKTIMGVVWKPNAPTGKCNIQVPYRTEFFTEYLFCGQKSDYYCLRDYCEKHCKSSCKDDCKEHRKEMEQKELEREKADIQRWKEEAEAQRNANYTETGLFETNSERKYRESNAEKWQIHLEKKEQELRELDDKMKKRPRKNDEFDLY